MKVIESAANPAVKQINELRKRRNRESRQRIIVEGVPETRRLIEAGHTVETLFVTDVDLPDLEAAAQSVVRLTGPAAARAMVRERGGGVIAIAPMPVLTLGSLPPDATFVVIAEAIEKPGNLGAMLRSADAAGVQGLMVCDPAVDPLNPNVVRASLGTVFTVPVAVVALTEAVTWCRQRSIRVVALDPGGSVPLYDTDLTTPIALAVGAEHHGLSTELRETADVVASLPMAGSSDSLNAATALAVAMFEAVRQRR